MLKTHCTNQNLSVHKFSSLLRVLGIKEKTIGLDLMLEFRRCRLYQ